VTYTIGQGHWKVWRVSCFFPKHELRSANGLKLDWSLPLWFVAENCTSLTVTIIAMFLLNLNCVLYFVDSGRFQKSLITVSTIIVHDLLFNHFM